MTKNSYVCINCGYKSIRWSGQCLGCGKWNSMTEEVEESILERPRVKANPLKLSNLRVSKKPEARFNSGFDEVDRVLGGGLVQGSCILLSGDPGIGKSTLLLQILKNITKTGKKAFYFSAEESINQISSRAHRLFGDLKDVKINVFSEGNVDSIIATIEHFNPTMVVVDSIQTVYTNDIKGIPGGISQIKECAERLIRTIKRLNVALVLTGHITKVGDIAGPMLLEHIVDGVFKMEGDVRIGLRIIRGNKNRFGPTDEIGFLKMKENGFFDVEDPSGIFLGKREKQVEGVVTGVVYEGTRPLLVEVQALAVPSVFNVPVRVGVGISRSKLQVLCAVIQKHCGVNLNRRDIYVNVSGDLMVKDSAFDLAVCTAIISSVKGKAIDNSAVIGAISLSGEIKQVPRIDSRIKEAKRQHFKNVYIPSDFEHKNIQNIVCLNSIQQINRIFS